MTAFKIQNFGTLLLVLMFQVWPSRATICSYDRFGPYCELKCRCQDGCKQDGECNDDTFCMSGYFGPFCQYVDKINSTDAPPWLKDTSSETCNPSQKRSIDITLDNNLHITWLRMIFGTTEDFDITVTLNDNLQACINQKNYTFGSTTFDVTCDNIDAAKNIRFRGDLVRSLCRLHISGARNVAFGQPTNQSSVYPSETGSSEGYTSDLAVDGYRTASLWHESCMTTNPESPIPPMWSVFYRQPYYLFMINILNRDAVAQRLKWFTLKTYDYKGKVIEEYHEPGLELGEYDVILTKVSQPVSWLSIEGSGKVDRVLTMCEVETYGEVICPEQKWGLYCSEECNCPQGDSCFVVTGQCTAGCRMGFYGFACLEPCSDHCVYNNCSARHGHCAPCKPGYTGEKCDTECPFGFYGDNCRSSCLEDCRGDACDNVNGTCLRCGGGVYGKDCSIPCPEGCHDRNCTMIQGSCFSCNTGYYGHNCSTPCPENCQDKKCKLIDGECFSCKTGYYQYNCSEPCPSECSGSACHIENGECLDVFRKYSQYFPAAIPLFLFLICLLLCRRRRRKGPRDEA